MHKYVNLGCNRIQAQITSSVWEILLLRYIVGKYWKSLLQWGCQLLLVELLAFHALKHILCMATSSMLGT